MRRSSIFGALLALAVVVAPGAAPAVQAVSSQADTTVPRVIFTMPVRTNSRTVAVTFRAFDNIGVTGYFLSEAATAPAVDDLGWVGTRPISFELSAANGDKTVYAWAKDAAGNRSVVKSDVTNLDTVSPVATLLVPEYSKRRNVPLTIGATDAVGVTGYFVSEASTTPVIGQRGWRLGRPRFFSVSLGQGTKTIYLWERDAAGNISNVQSDSVIFDNVRPVVTFTGPASSDTRTIAVTVSATDTNTIVGYYMSESPVMTNPAWSATPPTSFVLSSKVGFHRVYAWAKDVAGNVSVAKAITVTLNPGFTPGMAR